ncbi:hypothetical protein [Phenylobacterium sp.]|uniref:hypothetical protein n=1 Tax=Phenylobacterium sp. TaxID=1871053 RepID=UPI002CE4E329|nr:hypothetical protein [Phenylobacterium sp.]HLZ75760.1 hypothetical protein [Phenylobacterium sp.]
MSISSISSAVPTPLTQAAAAPPVTPRTDNDGDNDNGAPDVKASTPPGVGTKLDITT